MYQEQLLGNMSDIFARFHALWNPMWNRHVDDDASRWISLLQEMLPKLPQPPAPLELPMITVSAVGPDGVARFATCCECHNPSPTGVCNAIDQGKCRWPESVLFGTDKVSGKAQKPKELVTTTVLSQKKNRSIRSAFDSAMDPQLCPDIAGRPFTSTWAMCGTVWRTLRPLAIPTWQGNRPGEMNCLPCIIFGV